MGRYRWKLYYCSYVFAYIDKKCNIFAIFTLASPNRITRNYATAEASLHLFCECGQSRWQITIVQPVIERKVWIGYRPAPKFDGVEYFALREEIIYSSIEQIAFVKQLQRPIECGFYPSKSIRDLSEKLVEIRVWGCLERNKKDTRYIIVNLRYLRATVGAIFLHLNAKCKRIVNKLHLKIIKILVLFPTYV